MEQAIHLGIATALGCAALALHRQHEAEGKSFQQAFFATAIEVAAVMLAICIMIVLEGRP